MRGPPAFQIAGGSGPLRASPDHHRTDSLTTQAFIGTVPDEAVPPRCQQMARNDGGRLGTDKTCLAKSEEAPRSSESSKRGWPSGIRLPRRRILLRSTTKLAMGVSERSVCELLTDEEATPYGTPR